VRPRLSPDDILATTWHRKEPLPDRPWVQRQSWLDFPFLHWTVAPEVLRPHVPPELALDLRDGLAYVGIIPFRMAGTTLRAMPDVPGLSEFYELNVRTYVTHRGRRGVYFLSLDADNRFAVRAARAWFGLPYHDAEQSCGITGGSPVDRTTASFHYRSVRTHHGSPPAALEARWRVGRAQGIARPGSLEEWLCEQYCLFVVDGGRVMRGDVHHLPWPLHALEGLELPTNTMGEVLGLHGPPVHAAFSPGVDTVLWTLVPND
jgi:uncharacterized protein YqjF (DUF2071 family)